MSSLDCNEASFVRPYQSEETQRSHRQMFVDWALRSLVQESTKTDVRKFSLTMSRSEDYAPTINKCINFAVIAGMKHLELDFFDPKLDQNGMYVSPLPESVYQNQESLAYLKLYWCKLDFSRLTSFNLLKTLSLGYTSILMKPLRNLLISCPVLDTLMLERCVGMERLHISVHNSKMKNLVVDNCNNRKFLWLEGCRLRKFEYSGEVSEFRLGYQSQLIEARFDFWSQEKFDRSGSQLRHLMNQLIAVRFMTVCSIFLQIIPTGILPQRNRTNLNVQHLTMNTALHANEFIGIKFLLLSFPRMNTLTLCLVSGKILNDYEPPFAFNPATFWSGTSQVETCLVRSLLVLNVRGFQGSPNEMCLIRYIMYYGYCLRNLNLCLGQVEENSLNQATLLMQSPKANPDLEIYVVKRLR